MLNINKVSGQFMTERLDAEFYTKENISNEVKISLHPHQKMEDILVNIQLGYTGPTEKYYDPNGIVYLSSKNIIDGLLEVTAATDKISSLAHKDVLSKTAVVVNDVLIARTGNVGKAAVVTEYLGQANIAAHLIALRFKEIVDSYYVACFLNSKYGLTQSKRHQRGTIIQGLSIYDIPNFLIPTFNKQCQIFIGNKVRQAELLREWKKRQQKQLNELEAKIGISKPQEQEHSSIKVVKHALTENRLDSKYYQRKYLDLYAQFNHEYVKLSELCSGFKYGASVAAQYTEQGVPFIRGNAIYPNGINSKDIVKLDENLNDSLGSCFTTLNDILITRSGTVGVTTFVSEKFENFAYGSFIIKCKIIDNGYLPEYVSWFLNCWVGQQQFRRLENGAVQLNINIEELGSINIWKAPMELQLLIKSKIHQINICELLIDHVLTSSKLLVEGLIEGTITEDDLIQAQNALEQGDTSLDRSILSQMTEDGYAVAGSKPLFSDLDEFYDLLEQAKVLE